MRKTFYIHGGPGLNSAPEKKMLSSGFKDKAHDVYFWNEPSAQRSTKKENQISSVQDPFSAYLKALEEEFLQFSDGEKTQVIALSFGAIGAHHLASRFESKISRIGLISPAHHLKQTLFNIIQTSASLQHPKAAIIFELLKESHPERLCDEPFENALTLAFENPNVLPLYFENPDAFQNTLLAWQQPGFAPDFVSLFSVLKALDRFGIEKIYSRNLKISTLTLFGQKDLFCPVDAERKAVDELYTKDNHFLTLENARHYAHLDRSELFLKEFI